jgi:glutamine synthetase adenylyltransferase
MCVRSGGFALSLKHVPVLFDELVDRETLANMVRTASMADEARGRARSALYAAEPLQLPE